MNNPSEANIVLTEEQTKTMSSTEIAMHDANEMVVSDALQFTAAATFINLVKDHKKKLLETRMELTRPMDAAKKVAMNMFREPDRNLAEAERVVGAKMVEYRREEDAKQRKAEALAAEAARLKREKLEAQAEKAAEAGKEEKAEALDDIAEAVVETPVVVSNVPKDTGTTMKKYYSAKCFDLTELIEAVAAGKANKAMLQVNQVAINKQAQSLKDDFDIPGCEVVIKESIARTR